MYFFLLRMLSFAALSLLLTACANTRPININEWSAGMTTDWIKVRDYQLLVLKKPASEGRQEALHFYIEGDGTPWVKRFLIAEDPTPRYPLALELMKRDPQLSFYLGRPCYYQTADFYLALAQTENSTPCNFHYWTDARYSPEVVELMKITIEKTIKKLPQEKQLLPIILIGHSGGGTLAMLIAQRLTEVDGVITVAANMDTKAWTTRQGYSPLKKSLSVADETSFRNFPQVHLAGSVDDVVPPDINLPLMQKMGQSLTIVKGFNHDCCWLRDWPILLNNAEQQLKQQSSAHP